jgi:glycosyltransferase involved in cell wall biosynthesis
MADSLPLSVFVVTLDEEVNLRRCLESLKGMAAEIVVVDSGSRDGTRAVAEAFGAKWLEREWSGFRDQKNFGLEHCTQAWVLNLDADEEMSDDLRDSMRVFLERDESGTDGASFSRLSYFLGRWIRHGDWYPDVKLRLFRREKGRFEGVGGHDHLVMEGEGGVERLRGDLLHFSYPTMNDYIRKLIAFSDAHLQSELEKGRRWSLMGNLFRPLWRFFRSYVLRLGFLDGFPGFWVAVATGFSTFVRHSRLYEQERNSREKR